jgi:hypothetical protein
MRLSYICVNKKALGIPQHSELIGAFHYLKIESQAEKLLHCRNIIGGRGLCGLKKFHRVAVRGSDRNTPRDGQHNAGALPQSPWVPSPLC